MDLIRTTLAAVAMTVAAAASAQTLKMEPQVVGVTTYEASTAVNLVVVKPEIKLDNLDPSVFTVNTCPSTPRTPGARSTRTARTSPWVLRKPPAAAWAWSRATASGETSTASRSA